MIKDEPVQAAQDFLVKSGGYFAEGDVLQGSENLWGAASHAIMALAQQRGWDFGSHRAMIRAVNRISQEQSDRALRLEFNVAEQFHSNYYHSFMEEFQIENNRLTVRGFVERILALIDEMPEQSTNGIAE